MKYIDEFSINENKKEKKVKFGLFFNVSCTEETPPHADMYLYAMAKSSKDLEKLYGEDTLEISNKIKAVIEKKGLEVSWNSSHPGAGYWFKILPHSLYELIGIKKIEINV